MYSYSDRIVNLISAACIANSYAVLEIILAAWSQIIVANIAAAAENTLVAWNFSDNAWGK